MFKIILITLLVTSCAKFTKRSNEITSKIGKKEGSCSPLDKAQSKSGCIDEKVEAKKEALNTKVKKREGYCSPLDKAQKKPGCV